MRKQAATLETIAQTLEKMQVNEKHAQETLKKMQSSMDQRFEKSEQRSNSLERNMEDIQKNVEYLVANAVMKDDVRQIVREEMKPIMAPLYATMDLVVHKHQTFEGEVLAHGYRIGVIEKTLGLPNMV